jgi:hypothetical protein
MSRSYDDDYEDYEDTGVLNPEISDVTDANFERELEEIRDLERRKRTLEARVTGMERDLGGLMG